MPRRCGAVPLRLAAALLASGCGAPNPAALGGAITHGQSDGGDDNVVALLAGGGVRCSGVLLSPRVVLTAAHCLVPPPESVFFGQLPGADGSSLALAATRSHPDFDGVSDEADIGMVLLAAPATATPASPLQPGSAPPLAAGRAVRLVGFGASSAANPSDQRKRSGTTTVRTLADRFFEFGPEPSQTCVGDSGGPAFIVVEGAERVAGIAVSGDRACDGSARDIRVDAYASFIAAYLNETGAAGLDGGAQGAGCSVSTHRPDARAPAFVVLVALACCGRRARLRTPALYGRGNHQSSA